MSNKKNTLIEIARNNIDRAVETVIVRVANTSGSTPRDKNTIMLVEAEQTHDTIGGGHLEWIAIKKAHSVLGSNFKPFIISIPLGPEINQCCGGKMDLEFSMLNDVTFKEAIETASKIEQNKPSVFIFGAGHTGTELAIGFSRLPINLVCVDTRTNALKKLKNICDTIHTPLPEETIRTAPTNSSYIILTHDHNLDFMLAAEALARRDAAYVGMIGSATKKSVFKKWLDKNEFEKSIIHELTCPIGKSKIKDKRPNIIAALTIAEVLKIIMR